MTGVLRRALPGITILLIALLPAASLAAEPQGVLVQRLLNSTLSILPIRADVTAQPVNPGNVLVFSIQVQNQATATGSDMVNTIVTDNLPSGLTLLNEDDLSVGSIAPQANATVNVTAQVNSNATGEITNQACFTATSLDGSSPQQGCDTAMISVIPAVAGAANKPPATVVPTAPGTPSTGAATPLPDTGAALAATVLGTTGIAFAAFTYVRARRRANRL